MTFVTGGNNGEVFAIEVKADGHPIVDILMQPDMLEGGVGVAIVRWEDVELGVVKELLDWATGSLGRFMADHPDINVVENGIWVDQEEDLPF